MFCGSGQTDAYLLYSEHSWRIRTCKQTGVGTTLLSDPLGGPELFFFSSCTALDHCATPYPVLCPYPQIFSTERLHRNDWLTEFLEYRPRSSTLWPYPFSLPLSQYLSLLIFRDLPPPPQKTLHPFHSSTAALFLTSSLTPSFLGGHPNSLLLSLSAYPCTR